MSKIQTARYEQFTRRLLRIVGGSIMPILQNDLSPVLNIEDPADPALLFWKGHRIAAGSSIAGAVSARFSTGSVFNPLGSGALIVVSNILVRMPGTARFSLSFSQTRTLTVESDLSFIDTRASLVSVPKAEIGDDDFAAIPAAFWRQQANTTGTQVPIVPVLAPGTGLFVTHNTANTEIRVNFGWLERSAEISELDSA